MISDLVIHGGERWEPRLSEGKEQVLLIVNWASLMARAHKTAAMIIFCMSLTPKLGTVSGL